MEQLKELLQQLIALLEAEPGQVAELKTSRDQILALTEEKTLDDAEIERLKAEGNPFSSAEIKALLERAIALMGAATPPPEPAVAKVAQKLDLTLKPGTGNEG